MNEDNVYRFTYGTGSGSVTHGISMRYVLFFRNLLSYISHFFILQYNKNSQSVARDFPEELKKLPPVYMNLFLLFMKKRKV